jgi:hypothetical protein
VIIVSTGTILVIVVAIIVIAAVVIGLTAARRRRLQQRFGPEYDRLVGEHDSKLKAESELAERQRRVRELDIRPLTPSARATYADQWATLQERFVDAPGEAVAASQVLVVAVMSERGYPTEDHDQVLADLSVEHAQTLGRYRAAEEISASAAAGTASTEDLRQAMIHYRALFRDLLGDSAEGTGPADQDAVQDLAAAEDEESPGQAEAPEESRMQAEASEESRVQAEAPEESRVQDEAQLDEAQVPVVAADGQVGDERADIGDERADIPARRAPRS